MQRKPLSGTGGNEMKNNLVQGVLTFPPSIEKVVFMWPCWNCGTPFKVSRNTFHQLETKTLLGVKCPTCLTPSPDSGIVRVA